MGMCRGGEIVLFCVFLGNSGVQISRYLGFAVGEGGWEVCVGVCGGGCGGRGCKM